MPLYAETSDAVQIATLIVGLLTTVITATMTYFVAKLNQKATAAVIKTDQVAATLSQVGAKTDERLAFAAAERKRLSEEGASRIASLATKVDGVVDRVEEVHRATNSLTDRLVESTAKESHAAGVEAERKRQLEDPET